MAKYLGPLVLYFSTVCNCQFYIWHNLFEISQVTLPGNNEPRSYFLHSQYFNILKHMATQCLKQQGPESNFCQAWIQTQQYVIQIEIELQYILRLSSRECIIPDPILDSKIIYHKLTPEQCGSDAVLLKLDSFTSQLHNALYNSNKNLYCTHEC